MTTLCPWWFSRVVENAARRVPDQEAEDCPLLSLSLSLGSCSLDEPGPFCVDEDECEPLDLRLSRGSETFPPLMVCRAFELSDVDGKAN